jgi:PIN domain nuclease of toxin-antitoxin system
VRRLDDDPANIRDEVDRPITFVPQERERQHVDALPLTEEAILVVTRLPDLHRDPFDRMLVCQAIMGGLTLLTPDPLISQYPVPTLW